ncbi:hypothetical protein ES705_01324 [subsurface metagenome]|uniref:2TM domain-containing protein n=1 Tax=marine sediment metagenome TaxID=412755 RepID=X1B3I8_9ZZZZ|nr:histidine kinase [Clostridia bacterium]
MEDKNYEIAKKRVKEIKDFYTHLIIFAVVITAITIINLVQGEYRFPWFLFPFGFWGFIVLMHGLRTFVFGKGSRWEDRKIKEVMKQMKEDK